MNASAILLLGTGIIATGGGYFYALKKTGEKLITKTSLQVHSITDKIRLKATVNITNAGSVALRIDNLKVDVRVPEFGDKSIIQSAGTPGSFTIPAGQTRQIQFYLDTPTWLELGKTVGLFAVSKMKSSVLSVNQIISARVNHFIPVSIEEPTTLKIA